MKKKYLGEFLMGTAVFSVLVSGTILNTSTAIYDSNSPKVVVVCGSELDVSEKSIDYKPNSNFPPILVITKE